MNRLLESQAFRYGLAGAGTTLVNIAAFALLTWMQAHYLLANTLSFIASVVFAYVANEQFVFRMSPAPGGIRLKRGLQFLLLRSASYAADTGLMVLMVSVLSFHELYSKITVNLAIIVLNYLISKFHIFHEES